MRQPSEYINVNRAFHNPDLYARLGGQVGVNVKRAFHNPDLYARFGGRMGVNVKR